MNHFTITSFFLSLTLAFVSTPVFCMDKQASLIKQGTGSAGEWETFLKRMLMLPIEQRPLLNTFLIRTSFDCNFDLLKKISAEETKQDIILAVAWSPDGKEYLTGSGDGKVCLWDATTGNCIRDLKGHSRPIRSAVFSRDGKKILTGSADKTARLWDRETGDLLLVIDKHEGEVSNAAFDATGDNIYTYDSSGTVVSLWNAKTGEQLLKIDLCEKSTIYGVEFSPDGETFLTRTLRSVRLYSAKTGEEILMIPMDYFMKDDENFSIAFSHDSKTIFVGSCGKAYLYDITTQKIVPLTPHYSPESFRKSLGIIRSGTFSPDGKTILIITDDGTAHLLEVKTGKQLLQLGNDFPNFGHACAFSPNSETIIMAKGPLKGGELEIWSSSCAASNWIINNDEPNFLQTSLILKLIQKKETTGFYDIYAETFEHEIFMGLPEHVRNYLFKWYPVRIVEVKA